MIGFTVKSEKSPLQRLDALHFIVQMPCGVQVASVAINADIIATQILRYIDGGEHEYGIEQT
mgnify:CR=1 FL=1